MTKQKCWKSFFDYVKIMEVAKENKIDEDLDFEIDFGAYQIERKVSLKSVVKICGLLSISKLYLSFHRPTSTNRISKVAWRQMKVKTNEKVFKMFPRNSWKRLRILEWRKKMLKFSTEVELIGLLFIPITKYIAPNRDVIFIPRSMLKIWPNTW